MTDYLNHAAAGIPEPLWERIQAAAQEAAAELLTARRFLDLEGAFGVGMTSVETGRESFCRPSETDLAGVVSSRAIAVPALQQVFELSIRRVEGHLHMGLPLDLNPVEEAAEAVARREDEIVYYGIEELGISGLLNAPRRHRMEVGDWTRVEQALNDVLAAVGQLDDAGFRGPYVLALSPARYNTLFRRYEGSDMLQLDHLHRLCEGGVYKAPVEGGLVVDPRVGRLQVGQDLEVGYSANDGIHHKLFVSESLVLVLDEPEAACTLEETG
jgi:uncharacterized linocin/CFP29 family protein